MKKLISILLSGILIFGICGGFVKNPFASENTENIEAFADKVTEMVNEYGISPNVSLFSADNGLQDFETCRLIVKSEKKIDTLNAVCVISGYRNLWVLQFENPYDTAKAYEYYSSLGYIDCVQPDRPVEMQSTDDLTEEQKTWGSTLTHTDEVTDFLKSATAAEVKVGIIDSGIDYNNDVFKGRLIDNGINFSKTGDDTGMSDDPKSHGTHIAGIIAMNTLENTKLRAYKIFDSSGSSTELLVITAVYQAVSDGMDIINLSLGTTYSDILNECLQTAYESGTVIVTASGNKGIDCSNILPAAFDGAITVGAVDQSGIPCDFSNYGSTLDLVAPGVDIYSCLNNNAYGLVSGTSMATPFVSAASALILGNSPDMTPAEVENALKENTSPVNGTYPKAKIGSGILNTAQAIECPRAENSEIIFSDDYESITVSFSGPEGIDTYYTLNGDYPTKENAVLYKEPFVITESTLITWRSFSDDSSLFASKAESQKIRVFSTPDEALFTVDENGVLTSYSGTESSVTVPEKVGGITVVSVGEGAFEGTKASFKEIIFPETVKSIGANAFRQNKSIEYVKAEGLEALGESAFEMSGLKTFFAPSLETAGSSAFSDCVMLYDVNLESVKAIEARAFMGCTSLEELYLPETVTVADKAFAKSGIRYVRFEKLESCEAYFTSDCTVILPSTVSYLGFDSEYIIDDVNLKIYSAPGTYAEKWAKERHKFCSSEFIALPAITKPLPEKITDEASLTVEAIGFSLTYQWYGSTDGTENTLVPLDGETEKCFNIPEGDNYAGYFCKVTSTENGVSSSSVTGAVFGHLLPADYTAYNLAKSKVPSDLSVYTDESVATLNEALSKDVSGKIAKDQSIIDLQTQTILNAIASLKYKPADYTAVYTAIANIPSDLSPYTPDSAKAVQTAVDNIDYNLDITMQSTVDTYAQNIVKATENLEEEGFFARLFRLIKEFFEKLFSF